MNLDLLQTLRKHLGESDAVARKVWTEQIVAQQVSLQSLLSLFNADQKTAQRFMWLIGDLVEARPEVVNPCMPFLFSLRDEMPFPGMQRSVAKWLWRTNVPDVVEKEAIKQLFVWLSDSISSISCKSYSAKTLLALAVNGRVDVAQLRSAVASQTQSTNPAYRCRMQKLLEQLEQI